MMQHKEASPAIARKITWLKEVDIDFTAEKDFHPRKQNEGTYAGHASGGMISKQIRCPEMSFLSLLETWRCLTEEKAHTKLLSWFLTSNMNRSSTTQRAPQNTRNLNT